VPRAVEIVPCDCTGLDTLSDAPFLLVAAGFVHVAGGFGREPEGDE
jgi:hypothetical protein